ncbi:hypothetical protein ATO2_12835 [Roseovarius sp. 22II1-1F6A]|nr:hypothetical protein ATO2_12835 [Roseovarius sp. 22II1-1F6A]
MKTFDLEITSAVVIDGKIRAAGSRVTANRRLAVNLLQRGKAQVASGEGPLRMSGPIASDSGATEGDDLPLADHTVAELVELAAEYGIEGAGRMKKAELIAAIEAAEEGAQD